MCATVAPNHVQLAQQAFEASARLVLILGAENRATAYELHQIIIRVGHEVKATIEGAKEHYESTSQDKEYTHDRGVTHVSSEDDLIDSITRVRLSKPSIKKKVPAPDPGIATPTKKTKNRVTPRSRRSANENEDFKHYVEELIRGSEKRAEAKRKAMEEVDDSPTKKQKSNRA